MQNTTNGSNRVALSRVYHTATMMHDSGLLHGSRPTHVYDRLREQIRRGRLAGRRIVERDIVRPQAERYEWIYGRVLPRGIVPAAHEHDAIARAIQAGSADAARRAVEAIWTNAARRLAPALRSRERHA